MKKTMNKIQLAYMVAKARVQEIESQQEEIEKKYIADKGIVNPDGSTPDFLWCMEDDAAFEKANEECSALIVSAGLESALNAARDTLKIAEDNLIAYGLSLRLYFSIRRASRARALSRSPRSPLSASA